MILSTGMASLGDIDAAVAVCRQSGNDKLALLRCVSSYPAKPESMDLKSIDVLRGPSSVLYGQNIPGGMINLVTKRPTDVPLHEVSFGIGNYGTVDGRFDL